MNFYGRWFALFWWRATICCAGAGLAIRSGISAWIVVPILISLLLFIGFNTARSAAMKTLNEAYIEFMGADLKPQAAEGNGDPES